MIYRRWMWLWPLLFLAGSPQAAELEVAAMHLAPAPPWQRGAAEQEQADAVLLLEQPVAGGIGLQVIIPRHVPVLKTDAETYYANLGKQWLAQYGRGAAIGWTDAGGAQWLTCRHPARDKAVNVFHLSTVYQGRAYNVLVFVPAAVETLPREAYALLAGARFGEVARHWVKTRTLRAQPPGEVLETLVQGDATLLRGEGLLTGYGLEYGEASMNWFLEGFRWSGEDARAERVPFAVRGYLRVGILAEATASASLVVDLGLEQGEGPILARVRVHDICAGRETLEAALAQLDQGGRDVLQRQLGERPAACPEAVPEQAVDMIRAEAGKPVEQSLAIALPALAPPARLAQLEQAGLEWMQLVEVSILPGSAEGGLGDALLRRAGLFFLYRPGL